MFDQDQILVIRQTWNAGETIQKGDSIRMCLTAQANQWNSHTVIATRVPASLPKRLRLNPALVRYSRLTAFTFALALRWLEVPHIMGWLSEEVWKAIPPF